MHRQYLPNAVIGAVNAGERARQNYQQGNYAQAGNEMFNAAGSAMTPLAKPGAAFLGGQLLLAPETAIPEIAAGAAAIAGKPLVESAAQRLGMSPAQSELAGNVASLPLAAMGAKGANKAIAGTKQFFETNPVQLHHRIVGELLDEGGSTAENQQITSNVLNLIKSAADRMGKVIAGPDATRNAYEAAEAAKQEQYNALAAHLENSARRGETWSVQDLEKAMLNSINRNLPVEDQAHLVEFIKKNLPQSGGNAFDAHSQKAIMLGKLRAFFEQGKIQGRELISGNQKAVLNSGARFLRNFIRENAGEEASNLDRTYGRLTQIGDKYRNLIGVAQQQQPVSRAERVVAPVGRAIRSVMGGPLRMAEHGAEELSSVSPDINKSLEKIYSKQTGAEPPVLPPPVNPLAYRTRQLALPPATPGTTPVNKLPSSGDVHVTPESPAEIVRRKVVELNREPWETPPSERVRLLEGPGKGTPAAGIVQPKTGTAISPTSGVGGGPPNTAIRLSTPGSTPAGTKPAPRLPKASVPEIGHNPQGNLELNRVSRQFFDKPWAQLSEDEQRELYRAYPDWVKSILGKKP